MIEVVGALAAYKRRRTFMSYYISRTIESRFDNALAKVVDALKGEGFGPGPQARRSA